MCIRDSVHLAQGGEHLAYSMRGWYRLLWDLNIPVDFVDAEYDSTQFNNYKVLILPFPLSLSESLAKKLVSYVEKGGCLLSEAAPGRIDEYGFCPRGEMSSLMMDLFDVRQKSFQMIRELKGESRWSPKERTWGEYIDALILNGTGILFGKKLLANVYLQTFEAGNEAEVTLRTGKEVVGVRRRIGKGQGWLFGTYIGHNGTAYRDPDVHETVCSILSICGVSQEHRGKLILRKRIAGNKEAWIFINPLARSVREKIGLKACDKAKDMLNEKIKFQGENAVITVAPLDVRVILVDKAAKHDKRK